MGDSVVDSHGQSMDREAYLRQKKKETLNKLDNAKFGCFHVRACIVSGIGFFTVYKNTYSLFKIIKIKSIVKHLTIWP